MKEKMKVFLVNEKFGDLEITKKVKSYPSEGQIIVFQRQKFIVESVYFDFDDDEIRISVKKV